jgi:hypothetical protein
MLHPLIYLIIHICLLLEASRLCSAAWVLAHYHKPLVNYQSDEVQLEGVKPHTSEAVTHHDRDIDRLMSVIRLTYSLALLVFSVMMVLAAMFTEQTSATGERGLHPALAFFIFLIVWLAMMP